MPPQEATMRTLVYAVTAYALCMGTAEAFAPQFAVGLRSTQHKTALTMSGTSKIKNENPDDFATYLAKRKAAEDGVEWTPAGAAGPTRGDAQAARTSQHPSEPAGKSGYTPPYGYGSETIKRVTATATAGFTAVNNAPTAEAYLEAKGWRPPTGYGSETVSRSSAPPASLYASAPASAPATPVAAAGQGWRPPTGYGSETMQRVAASAPANTAPSAESYLAAKGWRPPTGYGSETVSRSSAPPAASGAGYSAPGAAPAGGMGWRPPTGYGSETVSRSPASNAPAYSSAPAAAAPMTSAPAKKWAPYGGGYDPKNRR